MEIIKSLSAIIEDYPIPGVLFAMCIIAIIIIATFYILYGIFLAIDCWFTPKRTDSGRIVFKGHVLGCYTMRGYYPETYFVVVEIDNVEVEVSLEKDLFNAYQINEKINVEFVRGRISGRHYVKYFLS